MLASIDGIKPDRMIHGYITAAIGVVVTNQEAVELLTSVQQGWPEPRPTLLELDHAIWRHQRRRTSDWRIVVIRGEPVVRTYERPERRVDPLSD